jgi:hypothetical protein
VHKVIDLSVAAAAAPLQAEATYFGTPRVEAFQLEGSLAGVDLLPLAAAAAPHHQPSSSGSSSSVAAGLGSEAPPAFVDGSPVRLRVSGAVALSAVRESSPAARRQAGLMGDDGYLFTGVRALLTGCMVWCGALLLLPWHVCCHMGCREFSRAGSL